MVMNIPIPSWTPKTNLLLLCPFESPSSKCCVVQNNFHHHHHGHGGLDIIDHAFGKEFPNSLLNELQGHGWIDDLDRGIVGRLKPARTKMDVDLACVLHRLGGNISMVYENNGDTSNPSMERNFSIRGDVSAFLPRHERMKSSFPTQYPYLHKLISSIERTVVRNCNGKQSNESTSAPNTNNTIHFQIDTNLTSVQIAKYAGDGKAGYPRHCDRGAVCLHELSNSNNAQDSNGGSAMERILTFVYYLTPEDWDQELDGGALRMYSPIRSDEANDNSTDHDLYFDIVPYSDRLVVFRSDIIEHQVLPSLRRDRIAITVWLYGRVVHTVPITEAAHISSSPLDPQPSTRDDSYLHSTVSLPPPLPVTTRTNTSRQEGKTIFVAIPSYRDSETWPTIKSLAEMALLPGRVYIGVVFQVDTASEEETKRFTTAVGSGVTIKSSYWNRESHFRSIVMDFRHSTGPCYARHLAQTLHRGEDYVLQIDSHMRFRPNWDEYLIQQLSKTECPEKSVLTTYPPGYDPPHGPGSLAETRATILVPWKFEDGILRQKGRLLEQVYTHASSNDNIPCLLYAGGFNFFHSSILETCPYDFKLHELFFGEEISMAVRLFSAGVDLFAPPQTVCYHLWKRNSLRIRVDNDPDREKQKAMSLDVVRRQLKGLGNGIGSVRSVEQFSRELGVDFENQSLAAGCEDAGLPATSFVSSLFSGCKIEDTVKNCIREPANDDLRSVLSLVSRFVREI